MNGLGFLDDVRVQNALREAVHKNLKDLDLGKSIAGF